MLINVDGATVRWVGEKRVAKSNELMEATFFIIVPKSEIKEQKTKLNIEFWQGERLVGKSKTTFLGPVQAALKNTTTHELGS
jgi:hypothetical protein